MEKVLTSFKNLYNGENVLSKHLILVLLLLVPSLCEGFKFIMHKNAPNELLSPVIVIAFVALLLLSIIPLIWLVGYYLRFMSDRLANKVGIPKIDFAMLVEGVKALPLFIAWTIYFIVAMLLVYVPLFLLSGVVAGVAIVMHGNILGILLMLIYLLVVIIALLLIFAFSAFVAPFYYYIIIEYAKYGHKEYMYNPLYLGNYMKVAFKDTFMVFIKFLFVRIIAAVLMIALYLMVVMVFAGNGIETDLSKLYLLVNSPETFVQTPGAVIIAFILFPVSAINPNSNLAQNYREFAQYLSDNLYKKNLIDKFENILQQS